MLDLGIREGARSAPRCEEELVPFVDLPTVVGRPSRSGVERDDPPAEAKVNAGKLGRKTGEGWYRY